MYSQKKPLYIAIISYKTAPKSAIYGLIDLFAIAEYASNFQSKIKVSLIAEDNFSLRMKEIPDIVIIPPSICDMSKSSGFYNKKIINLLLYFHSKNSVIISICAGTFILAETQLLNHREATTHWIYSNLFQKQFPKVILKTNKLLIDNGDVITAGGMMAWVDLGLTIIERFISRNIMLRTAQLMLIDPPRELQSPYIHFIPKYNHGDEAIVKAQRWLLTTNLRKVTVKDLVNQSKLEERTFLRRFKKATKLTPKSYLQYFKVEHARNILTTTNAPIDQISWEIGYADTSSFRKIFTKITCLTPREYRKKYGLKIT